MGSQEPGQDLQQIFLYVSNPLYNQQIAHDL